MRRLISITAALMLTVTAAAAIEPLWLRDVRISPDGTRIAFCYKGDIYTVPATGGEATRLTTQPSYESAPIWSPDGSRIAFASDRYGSMDVFVMSSEGGEAKRLTSNSAKETPTAFDAFGRSVQYVAAIQDPASSAMFPSRAMTELYSVPVEGGRPSRILGTPAEKLCWSADGSFFLYQDRKGIEDEWRKHHISSDTRDIWRYDVATGRHTNLTSRAGEDRDPVLSSDGRTVYCISEPPATQDGLPVPEGWRTSLNVYSFPLEGPAEMTPVSDFKTHPVRFLSIGGGLLCYTWNGEIYTQKPGSAPAKVKIAILRDDVNLPSLMSASSGATEACVSPDGKQIAVVVRGDVFVASVEYGTTRQITSTPAAESGVTFARDGRSLVYTSERGGLRQLFCARIVRAEDPDFPNATLVSEERLFADDGIERSDAKFSPDGKRLAFIQGRSCLMNGDPKSGTARQVTDGSTWFSFGEAFEYNWSPDGKWFALTYTPDRHSPYYDIGLVSSDGGPVTNLTASGYMCVNPKFTFDGTAVMFESERYGMRAHASWGSQDDVFLCFLNQEAMDRFRLTKEELELRKAAGKKEKAKDVKAKDVKVELDGIQDRIVRLTPASANLGDALLSRDGETLYYLASFEGGKDLWRMNVRAGETKLLCKGAGSGALASDGEGKTVFLLGKTIKKLDGTSLKPVSFKARYKLDSAAEREYMFDFVCREEKLRFYTADMHGVDWDAYCSEYRRFLPHIANNYDFAALLSELLGELNVSHTGARYYPSPKGESVASLGLLFDLSVAGKGLKIDEVLKGGPLDKAGYGLKAGDVITAIDGVKIDSTFDPMDLLAGKAGKKTLLSVKGRGDIVVVPGTGSAESELLYKRWVRARAEDVAKWSGGRLGYVHIKSMNDASFRDIYSDILGKYNLCEGIVIDTRFNGGGRMHEDIEILFSGRKYLTQTVRGAESCDMPSRRWNKPSIMVQGEANYSNAHGTPWVYRTMGIGKLVGAPVPGTMTSVNWVRLQDDSMLFGIPVVGYMTSEGHYLENCQLEPDILVLNRPEDVVKGEDAQLRAAVSELLEEIDSKKVGTNR